MKKRSLWAAAAAVLLVAVTVMAAEGVKLDDVKCVVAPRAAKAENAVDYKGGKVFFCCQNCPKAFTADTAKFAHKANLQLAATGQAAQKACPLSGQPIADGTEVKVSGVAVKFCCPNCQGKVAKAEGDEQIKLVFDDKAFEKGFKVGKSE